MNELIPLNKEQEYELMKKHAAAFYQSGMFPDIKSHAQALVKVMAGSELGLPPFASMTGIHVVVMDSGTKIIIGANAIATLIASHPNYYYRIVKATKEICEIEFYESKNKISENGSLVGSASFTIQEAQEAGLLGKNTWKKYASDMLFARAISRGARRFAPGIFGGSPVYTPDELDIETDEDGVVLQKKLGTIDNPIHPQPMRTGVTTLEFVPERGSDEAIIEDIKKTHVINEEFR